MDHSRSFWIRFSAVDQNGSFFLLYRSYHFPYTYLNYIYISYSILLLLLLLLLLLFLQRERGNIFINKYL
jgi:hypothetical protein